MKNQAITLFQSGKLSEAMQAFTQACQQNPADAECWMMLGVTQAQLGAMPQAIAHLKHATQIHPGFAAAWSNLGLALLNANQLNDAETCLIKARELNPRDPGTWNSLGTLYRQEGKASKAIEAFQQAIKLQPRNPHAHNNLGSIFQGQCRAEEAIAAYKRALQLDPQFVQAEYNLGTMLQAEGRHQQALYHLNKALKLNPSLFEAIAAIADMQQKEGRYEEAKKTLTPYLKGDATPAPIVLSYAGLARRIDETEEAIHLLENLTKRPDLSLIDRQRVEFALGDALDKEERYDNAFLHYQLANNLRAYTYNRAATERHFDKIASIFPANCPSPQATKTTSLPVVMIVGMPRSSTSLVEQILASHPNVHGGGELAYIGNLIVEYSQNKKMPFPDFISQLSDNDILLFGKKYLKLVRKLNPKARLITDKMPHNFLYLGLLAKALPGLKIIHCKRNPLDTCLSIFFHNFNSNHPYTTNLSDLGHYYRQYDKLMAHWHKFMDDQILDLTYEKLITDQENLTRKLLEFCGLDWHEDCLDFHKSNRLVNTPSYDQVRRPIYKTSSERWRNYETHITPLIDSLKRY